MGFAILLFLCVASANAAVKSVYLSSISGNNDQDLSIEGNHYIFVMALAGCALAFFSMRKNTSLK
jgi:hypothetical protein